ncbi:MAG: hypothetical protein C5B52_06225 [Bacteroidetes bacterium]|nr:MAG: hypothetical protein C5B52_06225 [Bacteroidota bacterium]
MDILVFKTNIVDKNQIPLIAKWLSPLNGILKWNIDWHDKDKILRIESNRLQPEEVEIILQKAGYYCEELE